MNKRPKRKKIQVREPDRLTPQLAREWDNHLTGTGTDIPDYRVYADKHAQGYISILKKSKRYKQYLGAIMKPGGIRPLRQKQEITKSDSIYSDKSRKDPFDRSNLKEASKHGSNASVPLQASRQATSQGVRKLNLSRVPDGSRHMHRNSGASQNRGSSGTYIDGSEPAPSSQADLNNDTVAFFKSEIEKIWEENSVPPNHRALFMDNVASLNAKVFCSIIAKEIDDFQKGSAPIQKVLKVTQAREECLSEIADYNKEHLVGQGEPPVVSQDKITYVAKLLNNLRTLSIHVVECIVLWRDQMRYVALLNQQKRGNTKKPKGLIPSLQIPFFTTEGKNYLVKMKTDTLNFVNLEMGKYYNFSSARSDPFLITASLNQSHFAAGSKISAIKKGRQS